eukprot:NODE_140_length_1976_cov_339.068194.p10 GENE.NODE_140_length_1976_cov_339.068194~~NODE_140_length_1976_cov_339.068194.p10  ORF type:complete len:56 (+),score=3.76 NODE_140_length_1976_cov_339.068194:1192-1359(+)
MPGRVIYVTVKIKHICFQRTCFHLLLKAECNNLTEFANADLCCLLSHLRSRLSHV